MTYPLTPDEQAAIDGPVDGDGTLPPGRPGTPDSHYTDRVTPDWARRLLSTVLVLAVVAFIVVGAVWAVAYVIADIEVRQAENRAERAEWDEARNLAVTKARAEAAGFERVIRTEQATADRIVADIMAAEPGSIVAAP